MRPVCSLVGIPNCKDYLICSHFWFMLIPATEQHRMEGPCTQFSFGLYLGHPQVVKDCSPPFGSVSISRTHKVGVMQPICPHVGSTRQWLVSLVNCVFRLVAPKKVMVFTQFPHMLAPKIALVM